MIQTIDRRDHAMDMFPVFVSSIAITCEKA